MNPDVRWKQRFTNFDRALTLLEEAMADPSKLTMLEKEGTIQRFEYSMELAWKTIKDYLEEGGIAFPQITPRQVLKDAYAAKVISDGQVWIDMVNHRNLLSHTYDSQVFDDAIAAIDKHYLAAMKGLRVFLAAKLSE